MGYWAPQVVTITRQNTKKYVHYKTSGGVVDYMTVAGEGICYFARVRVNGGGIRNSHLARPYIDNDQNFRGWDDVDVGAVASDSYAELLTETGVLPLYQSNVGFNHLIQYEATRICTVEWFMPWGFPFKTSLQCGATNTNANDLVAIYLILEGDGLVVTGV